MIIGKENPPSVEVTVPKVGVSAVPSGVTVTVLALKFAAEVELEEVRAITRKLYSLSPVSSVIEALVCPETMKEFEYVLDDDNLY